MWQVLITKQAQKELLHLQSPLRQSIAKAIEDLAHDPFPNGYKKLKASENIYRIRIKVYRVLYLVDKSNQTINIAKIAHRKDVYRA